MPRVALVPLDGSELGEAALATAAYLARQHDLTLVLLRVVPFPLVFAGDGMTGYSSPAMYEEFLTAGREEAADYLEATRQRLASDGLQVETIVREGHPTDHILDLADDLGARFIALATHGRGGLIRLALGSVTEHILQRAAVPVLLVRIQDDAPARTPAFRRILVPMDGSSLAEHALDVAAEFSDPGAELYLVSVDQRLAPPSDGDANAPDMESTEEQIQATIDYLKETANQFLKEPAAVQTLVRLGDPADEILQAARDHDTDIIVMSTHGNTGPARWLLGSVADRVVRDSRRPVLLASARALAARAAGDFVVNDVMTRDLTTVLDTDSLMVAVRKLLRQGISGAPVVNAAADLVGILTEHNVIEWQVQLGKLSVDERPLSPDEFAVRLLQTSVRDIMTQPALAVEDTSTLSTAIELFQERRARPLPVTHDGKLVGVIRRADVLKAMVSHWRQTELIDEPAVEGDAAPA